MYRESNLGLLIKLAPKEAASKISQAFLEFDLHDQETEGRALELVAKRLDCSASSLKRHLRVLEQLGINVRRATKASPVQAPPAHKPAKSTAKKAAKKAGRKKRAAA